MQKGRRPIPTRLKLIQGNPGKRPLNQGEAEPPLSRPMPPEHLSDDAKVEWGRVIDRLFDCGLMTDLDRAALAAYCDAYGNWAEACRGLAELRAADQDKTTRGLVTKTSNGNQVQHVLIGIQRRARYDMVRYAAEFGMTPSARSRIDIGIGSGASEKPEEKRGAAAYF